MNVQRFRVYLDAGPATPTELDLAILPADRMRAERASTTELPPSQRGPNASQHHPNTWVLLWLWCAATRAGSTAAKFADWSLTVLDFDRLDADGELIPEGTPAEDVEDPQVDPTSGAGATS